MCQEKKKGLRVDKMQPVSKEKYEVVEKDQELQQVVELKLEDSTFTSLIKRAKKRRLS